MKAVLEDRTYTMRKLMEIIDQLDLSKVISDI